MSDVNQDPLAEIVNKIEASYEFMLAYAAQGRESENTSGGAGPSIREFLLDLEGGLEQIALTLVEVISSLGLESNAAQAMDDFKEVLAEDAKTALKAVRLVQSVPSISSQLIDNLNASAHLRCLLTDIFVIDEAIKAHTKAK